MSGDRVARTTKAAIGERIRARREYLGMTQADLGRLIGTTSAAISNYERGTNEPGATSLDAMATALLCNVSYFYGEGETGRESALAGPATKADVREVLQRLEELEGSRRPSGGRRTEARFVHDIDDPSITDEERLRTRLANYNGSDEGILLLRNVEQLSPAERLRIAREVEAALERQRRIREVEPARSRRSKARRSGNV